MRRLLTFGAAVLSLVLFAGAASGASQAELEELNRQISRLSEQIEAARSARTQAAEEVLATKARLDSVTAELRQAEGVLASINAEIAAGEEELASVTRMLEHFESMLATTRLKAEDTRSALSRQVIEMYMSASTAPAKVLSFASAEEAWVGLAYVDGARGDSSQLLRQLDVLEAEEERQQGILDEQRRAQERLLAELAEQREAQEAESTASVLSTLPKRRRPKPSSLRSMRRSPSSRSTRKASKRMPLPSRRSWPPEGRPVPDPVVHSPGPSPEG